MRELWGGRGGKKRGAKRQGSVNGLARLVLAMGLAGAAVLTILPEGLANPKGGQITAGSATISNSSPVQLDINHTIQSVGLGIRSDLTSWLFLETEGVHRLTTHPQGKSVATEAAYAFFTRVTVHY